MKLNQMYPWNDWSYLFICPNPCNHRFFHGLSSVHIYHKSSTIWGWLIGELLQEAQITGHIPVGILGVCNRRIWYPQSRCSASLINCTTFRCRNTLSFPIGFNKIWRDTLVIGLGILLVFIFHFPPLWVSEGIGLWLYT